MTSILLASVLALSGIQAQPPTATLALDQTTAIAGGPITGTLTITFADGLHGYQNPPSLEYQIPVSVSAGSNAKRVIASYPMGEPHKVGGESEASMTYSGTVVIPVVIGVGTKPGMGEVQVKVRYQQCTDSMCFPPATLTAGAKIQIKAAPKGWNAVAKASYWAKSMAGRR